MYGERGLGVAVLDILGPLSPIWQARSLNGEVALLHAGSARSGHHLEKVRDAVTGPQQHDATISSNTP